MRDQSRKPRPSITTGRAYAVPQPPTPVDLQLMGNEGLSAPEHLWEHLAALSPELIRRYPDRSALEAQIASMHGLDPAQVLVTAGADEAIDRCCRCMLGPQRELLCTDPTFSMIPRYAALNHASVRTVTWADHAPFPAQDLAKACTESTGIIALVSPNNPNGQVLTHHDLETILEQAAESMVMLDHAYVEFADEDSSLAALRLDPRIVVLRTLSKAYGMAGLRCGYVMGDAEVIGWLRAAGSPYSVAAPSIALAAARLQEAQEEVDAFRARIRQEREQLQALCEQLGMRCTESQGNFVFARHPYAIWIRDALAGLGIGVRAFPGVENLQDALRITLPGDPTDFDRLCEALRIILAPQAILFDVDGVLVDVSHSYRAAIKATAASFGLEVDEQDILQIKLQGDANNDWILTQRLLERANIEASLDEVTARFEALYQGDDDNEGLRQHERLLVDPAWLQSLAARLPLAAVTGRPRADCDYVLERFAIARHFTTQVCMHEAPAKPSPAPLELAMQQLGIERAWMLGDTLDDITAARAAGVLPLAVLAPGDDPATITGALHRAGASRVLDAPLERAISIDGDGRVVVEG